MLDSFADLPNTLRFIDVWLAADAKAKAAGLQNFEAPSTSVWPRLPSTVLQTTMAVWHAHTAAQALDLLSRFALRMPREAMGI